VLPRTAQMSASVRRKLDFSNDNLEANVLDASISNASPQKRTALANLTNGTRQAALGRSFSPVDAADDGEDETAQTQDDTGFENAQESFQMIDGGENEEFETQQDKQEEQEEQAEPEYAAQLEPPKKGRGKARPKESEIMEVPAKRGRGRKKRESILPLEQDVDEPLAKRTRRSLEGGETVPEVGPKAKATKVGKTNAAAKTAKPKAAAMKAKLAPISEAESPEVQRGPPMPRNNRGLIILRRETPLEGAGFKQTRSGRNSIKPVAYWKNERIEYSEDENEDQSGGRFLLPRIKGVVRADEVDERRPKKSCHKPSKGKKRKAIAATAIADMEEDNDDEAEPWEAEPGRVFGDIRIWDSEDQTGMKAEEIEEEIALSSAAIITRDIANATFKFAKTLTLPFFGSGMVDLPPGAVKKPKNSRKMQMVFFVFYGRVEVTVNDTTFRIGKGGMWQVPRGM
jgi:centromere protein C